MSCCGGRVLYVDGGAAKASRGICGVTSADSMLLGSATDIVLSVLENLIWFLIIEAWKIATMLPF